MNANSIPLALLSCQEKSSVTSKDAFTQRLNDAVRFAGLSWNGLAERLSADGVRVYASTTTEWRDGSIPSGEFLMRLPAILGVNGHWLLTGEGDMTSSPDEAERLLAQIKELLGVRPGGGRKISD